MIILLNKRILGAYNPFGTPPEGFPHSYWVKKNPQEPAFPFILLQPATEDYLPFVFTEEPIDFAEEDTLPLSSVEVLDNDAVVVRIRDGKVEAFASSQDAVVYVEAGDSERTIQKVEIRVL